MRRCLVRGSGDVGSAVAHALFTAGFAVAMHDVGAPAYPRRGRAFLDALFDGTVELDGVTALRVDRLDAFGRRLRESHVGLTSQAFDAAVAAWKAEILVDARMRKRQVAEPQRSLAPLVIGIGPGFAAGQTAHLVVESAWGGDMGRVISHGSSAPFTGVPRTIGGYGSERYRYAPADGRFVTDAKLGVHVCRGEVIGRVGDFEVDAPIDGVIVGLTRGGVELHAGAKILEVDPRGRPELAFGIGERPRRIGEGVLCAIALHDAASRGRRPTGRSRPTFASGALP